MSDFEEFIPEHIRALDAYSPGKLSRQAKSESGVDSVIKLASNENPFGPSPKALAAIRQAAALGNIYPDNDNLELRTKLAQRFAIELEQILVTGGSTQFLDVIARTLLAPGLNAVTSQRTFIVYALVVRAAGGELIQTPVLNDGFDLDAIANAINPATRIVLLANPNNPTGTMFDAAALGRFLQRMPEHVLVVLDEAYIDYAHSFASPLKFQYPNSLDYVRQGRNVVVLRTFSKCHGLAGIRVGYGFGPAALLQHFARVRTAFSVSCVAEAAALAAMDDDVHVRQAVENNLRQSKWLAEKISELGFRVVPTAANFLYFDVGEDAAGIAKRIQAEGIIVRPLTLWGSPTALRVTVGTPEQNARFVAALKQVTARAVVR